MESMSLFASLSLFPVRHRRMKLDELAATFFFRATATTNSFPMIGGVNYLANIFMRPELQSGFIIRKTSSRKYFCTVRSTVQGGFRDTMRTSGEEEGTRSFIWHKKQNPRICILGGGFGGLYTALRLESLEWPPDKKPQVLLVDQSERFVFKPLLYELLTGEVDEWEVAPRFSELLSNTSVQFVPDRVKEISPSDHFDNNDWKQVRSGGQVHLASGLVVDYDWLVLSLGAQSKLDAVPGASDFALPFQSLEDARRVDQKLRVLERGRFCTDPPLVRVAVVGCGYSGVELAASISERLQERGKVSAINVGATICPSAPSGNREAALKRSMSVVVKKSIWKNLPVAVNTACMVLSSRNVQLYLGYYVRCIKKVDTTEHSDTSVTHNRQNLQRQASENFILELQPTQRGLQSQSLGADLILWTVGSKPLLPTFDSKRNGSLFPSNSNGQAETDETLRVKGHPRIFAIGDAASLRDSSGRLLPATAQVAIQQADYTGWNLWAAINERPLLPFRFQNLGEMMTLGRFDGVVTPSFMEGLTLEGPVGHAARRFAYLLRLPTDEHRMKVGFSWLTKSAVDSLSLIQSTLAKSFPGTS